VATVGRDSSESGQSRIRDGRGRGSLVEDGVERRRSRLVVITGCALGTLLIAWGASIDASAVAGLGLLLLVTTLLLAFSQN
jgi:hypothetical protein